MPSPSLLSVLSAFFSPHCSMERAAELARLARGVASQLGEAEVALATTFEPEVEIFYQDDFPLRERGRRRWRRTPRPLTQIDCYGMHCTGVRGGFGVTRQQTRVWLRRWDQLAAEGQVFQGDPPSEHRSQLTAWIPDTLPTAEARQAWARLQALRTRYLGLPYHSISSVPELVINHRPDTYTHHGNKMNAYTWGHAIDDRWPDDETVSHDRVELELARLDRLHRHLRDSGAHPVYIECHSQHARKNDPGAQYVERVLLPFARAHSLSFRSARHTGGGRRFKL